jgi:hypothetical protein
VAGDSDLIIDREGHGTAVAGVAAAAANGSGIMGVAFQSTIISLNTAAAGTCTADGCSHYDDDIAEAVDIARENGARVINISLGGPTVEGVLIDALVRAAEAGIVVVISAGNESEDAPKGFAQVATARASTGNMIIAGAVDRSGNIAGFSNRAGDYGQYYLTALGVAVNTFDESGARTRMDGTSFSAPVISGAAALLASAFPNLSGAQIVDILLRSADDSGAAGVDSIYGHGRLNITRAFQPIGSTSLAGTGTALSTTDNGEASAAMGDAAGAALSGAVILDGYSRAFVMDIGKTIRRAMADRPLGRAIAANTRVRGVRAGPTSVTLTVLRKLDGEATVGLAQTGMTYEDSRQVELLATTAVTRLGTGTKAALGISETGHRLRQRLSEARTGAFLVAQDPAARHGFQPGPEESFGLRQQVGHFGLTVTSERGEVSRLVQRPRGEPEEGYRLTSVMLDRRIGAASLSFGMSYLQEEQTLLGGRMSGDLFGVGSSSTFFDAGAATELGRGFGASLDYRRGWTNIGRAGALADGGQLVSEAFSLGLRKDSAFVWGDSLGFRIAQPLRVVGGGIGVRVPVSYDYATGAVGFENRMFNLSPSGREVDFETAYSLRLGEADLGANLFLRRHPGHIRDEEHDVGGAVRVSWDF